MTTSQQPEKDAPDMERVWATLRDLVDPDPCWFDHHGGCQAHGFLDLEPGQLCAHEEAKRLLAQHDAATVIPPAPEPR